MNTEKIIAGDDPAHTINPGSGSAVDIGEGGYETLHLRRADGESVYPKPQRAISALVALSQAVPSIANIIEWMPDPELKLRAADTLLHIHDAQRAG